jgi:hypothetical protein
VAANCAVHTLKITVRLKDDHALLQISEENGERSVELNFGQYLNVLILDLKHLTSQSGASMNTLNCARTHPKALLMAAILTTAEVPHLMNGYQVIPLDVEIDSPSRKLLLHILCNLYDRTSEVIDTISSPRKGIDILNHLILKEKTNKNGLDILPLKHPPQLPRYWM